MNNSLKTSTAVQSNNEFDRFCVAVTAPSRPYREDNLCSREKQVSEFALRIRVSSKMSRSRVLPYATLILLERKIWLRQRSLRTLSPTTNFVSQSFKRFRRISQLLISRHPRGRDQATTDNRYARAKHKREYPATTVDSPRGN